MKKKITVTIGLILLFAMIAGLMSGCAGGGGGASAENFKYKEPKAGSFKGRELNVLYMVGGQGEMVGPIIDSLKAKYEGLTINITYDHKAADIMRTKVMANETPDIFDLNQGYYDYYAAINEGVCLALDPIFEVPTLDGKSKLGDILDLNSFTKGYVNGHYYLFPDCIYTSGVWYDARLLRELGVEPPKTWDQWMAACKAILDKGVTPFAYNGINASEYFMDYFFMPMVASLDFEAYKNIQNLKENAWSSDAVMTVLDRIAQMRDLGYIASASPNYQDIQIDFCNNKFVFYPCGSWLENEMHGDWPENYELSYLPFSGAGDGGTTYMAQVSVVSAVSASTKNLDIVAQWYREFFSNPDVTAGIVKVHMNGLAIKDFAKNFGSIMPSSVTQTWEAVSSGASKPAISMYSAWYYENWVEYGNAINAFFNGTIDAKGFADKMNALDTAKRNDSSVVKYTY
jgi:N-acetylglucosamine transport system substrate-binding protein